MNHLVLRFVEGLRPEISQMIKNHLICWQAKPIDEVLQYAKYCSDEIELKQRKLKEKVMVMQIKAAQEGMQGNGLQQMVQQLQGNGKFQAQMRGRGRGGFVNRGPDLNTVVVQNDVQGMKKTNSDDEGDDGQISKPETETTDEEYPLISFFPMFTATDLPADLQGTVKEKVWDLTGKEVGLIKGVEPIKVSVKPNAVFPQVTQYHMTQDVLIQVYSWCRIPKGFSEPPSIFNQILKKDLESLQLPFNSTLVQYIDDLLIASKTRDDCKYDTTALLNHLGKNGHKVSPKKLQYCQKVISKPLVRLSVKEVKDGPDVITLTEKEMKAFIELRECMCRAPALDMPDYTKPFVLFCHERDACSLSVLTQVHGGANRPVAYFSVTLDPVAASLPGCLRAVAAVGQSLTQCEGMVMGHPLTVMVPHSVEILLTRTKTQHMTNARLTKYETTIVGSPNVTLKRCTVLNPATLLPNENTEVGDAEEVEHDCLEVEATTLPLINDPGHNLKAGDWVVVKKHMITTAEKEVSGPEINQRGTETEGEPVEDGLVTPITNETQRGDEEPISTEAPGGPTQREVLPEADGCGIEVEPLTDPESGGVEAEANWSAQTPPEPIAGPSRENTIESEEGNELPQGRSKTRETLRGDKWPKSQVTKGKVVVDDTIEEEVDTTRKEDLSEGELQGDRKLKRKRIANRRS
ncbi:hypothetical protein NDU88_004320 [Pleurodeles waltl]|uniref:ribonuclease H n=1 Tax=Pleurodeles waltl TaxID=8319 RepID=A0AAV7PFN8_PLEWA|nr:hypothetical protein NDU88_004320 [Pleurodeles waltl]